MLHFNIIISHGALLYILPWLTVADERRPASEDADIS